jgi:hypothetical protein
VVVKVELINGAFVSQGRLAPPLDNSAVPALLQFQVREAVEDGEGIEIGLFGLCHYGIELPGHAFKAQGG